MTIHTQSIRTWYKQPILEFTQIAPTGTMLGRGKFLDMDNIFFYLLLKFKPLITFHLHHLQFQKFYTVMFLCGHSSSFTPFLLV